jgi:hypothetical protein
MRAVVAGRRDMNGIDARDIIARTVMRERIMIMSGADIGGRGRESMRVIRRAIPVMRRERGRGLGGEIEEGLEGQVYVCDYML